MKISLHAEFDAPEEWSAFIDMLVARPVAVRAFDAPHVELKSGDIVTYKDTVAIVGAQKQERQPSANESAPVVPPATAEAPSTVPAEPAAATAEEKKPRGRGKRQAAPEAPPATPDPAVSQATPATKPTTPKGGAIEVTRDDLMKTFASYVQRYGTNFGYTDVSKMLTDTFGPGVRKSSDVTDDNLAKAVAVVSAAIESNPFSRKRADVN